MTLNIREVAEALETDPRTARRFLRDVAPGHERGKRWEVKPEDIPELKLLFDVRVLGLKNALEVLDAARHER